ncbi:arylesterase [Alphaproteobacteria bacterium]|nr:arylesterase [Alphaproteobacteria bacterium]
MKYIIKLNFTIFFFLLILMQTSYSKSVRILILGDSLIAGYGLLKENGFVNQLQKKLDKSNLKINLINSGVSGETSTGLYNRFKWVLEEKFDGVVISSGANDALRGIEPKITFKNLENILIYLKKNKMPTMLIGMKAPNNLGSSYVNEFNKIYKELAQKYQTNLYPFFLKDVVLNPNLNQSDMIHPNKIGVKKIVENIYPEFLIFYKKILY